MLYYDHLQGITMNTLKVGDTVQVIGYVCGKQYKAHLATIAWLSDDGSVAKTDRGSLHGRAPWLTYEATSHLEKVVDKMFDPEYDCTHQLNMKEKYALSYQ